MRANVYAQTLLADILKFLRNTATGPSCANWRFKTDIFLVRNIVFMPQAIVEFHTATSTPTTSAEGSGDKLHDIESGEGADKPDQAEDLEMPEDGSTTIVSGKGLTCTVRGLKVRPLFFCAIVD